MKTKPTKDYFCRIYPEMNKLRRKDKQQFDSLYNDWKRLRNNGHL